MAMFCGNHVFNVILNSKPKLYRILLFVQIAFGHSLHICLSVGENPPSPAIASVASQCWASSKIAVYEQIKYE
jgi:hypothetical protein